MSNIIVKSEDEKRNDIVNNIDYNMFVEAGAGAGKTTILIARIINQLKTGKYKPEDIVAITFTKKAAEELKTRMITELQNQKKEATSECKNILTDALLNLDKMQLSTIHSFCFKLLIERIFEANLRMDVEMLEESEDDKDKKDFFSNWFKSKATPYEDYKKLCNLGLWDYYDLAYDAFKNMVDLPKDFGIILNEDVLSKSIEDFDDEENVDNNGKNDNDLLKKEYQSNFIINYVKPAVKEYRKINNNHYISNNQLLIRTRKLLTDENVRKYFQKKYKTIYVDEFQDTDKLQVDIIYSLCKDENGRFRDGSLFLVGDPKQSIYRFRGADVELYNSVKKEMSECNDSKIQVFELNYNYRTCSEVLDFVNKNAKKQFLDLYTKMESKSKSNDCKNKNLFKGVYHTGYPNSKLSNSIKTKGYSKEKDIERLIHIVKYLANKKDILIFDKNYTENKEHIRPIKYKDFLILCKSKSDMYAYMDEMMKEGIPVKISSDVSIASSRIFYNIKNIYSILAYPYDKRSRVAFAQSYYDNVYDNDKKDEINTIINKIRSATKNMDAYTKLLYVIHNMNLYNNKNVNKNNIVRIQCQVQQMYETIITTRQNNEIDVCEGIKQYINNGYEREISLENDVEAVRFMNLHKAKGLEGKIVIICKRSFVKVDEYSTVHEINDDNIKYYLCICNNNLINKIKYPSYYSMDNKRLTNMSQNEELNEKRRLAYVECTRPMEALIYLDGIKLGEKNKDLFSDYEFDNTKYLYGNDAYNDIENKWNENVEKKVVKKYESNLFILDKNDKQKEYKYKELSPSDFEKSINIKIDNNKEKQNKILINGAIYGTIMHRSFELIINNIINNKLCDDKFVNFVINKSIIESAGDIKNIYEEKYDEAIKEFFDNIKEDVNCFINDEEIKKILINAKNVYAERPFKIKDEEGNYINGKADLIIENNDNNIIIVDYKSDHNPGVSDEEFKNVLKERYKGQLELYKKSFAKIYDIKNKNILTYIYNRNGGIYV